jgi:hypothetical protein
LTRLCAPTKEGFSHRIARIGAKNEESAHRFEQIPVWFTASFALRAATELRTGGLKPGRTPRENAPAATPILRPPAQSRKAQSYSEFLFDLRSPRACRGARASSFDVLGCAEPLRGLGTLGVKAIGKRYR